MMQPTSATQDMRTVGVRDPVNAPARDLAIQGRVPTYAQQPLFFMVFSEDDPDVVMQALRILWPEMARKFAEGIGNTLLKHDSRYRQRWEPLKPATLKARRAEGNLSDYPYSDRYANDWWINRWGTSLAVEDTTITAGVGPSEQRQSHTEWSETKESQYGTQPGHGVGPEHQVQKPARPLGLSEEIAGRLLDYARQRLPALLRQVGAKDTAPRALLAPPDMIQAQLPLWVS